MRLLLAALSLAVLALSFPSSAKGLAPRPRGFHFYANVPLDVSQVEDHRGQTQKNCVYVGGHVYCTWGGSP